MKQHMSVDSRDRHIIDSRIRVLDRLMFRDHFNTAIYQGGYVLSRTLEVKVACNLPSVVSQQHLEVKSYYLIVKESEIDSLEYGTQ